jgi:hypothetical protein
MSNQAEGNDVYDLAADKSAVPVVAAPASSPTQKHTTVLDYSGPAMRSAETRSRPGNLLEPRAALPALPNVRIDPADPFEGNRFKNLYVPIVVLVASVIFTLAGETVFAADPALDGSPARAMSELVPNAVELVIVLALNVPVMLIACVAAAWLVDAYFGSLFLAVFKLASIALVQSGLVFGIGLVGWAFGKMTGSEYYYGWCYHLGILLGALLGLVAYFRLFMYYFDLQFHEAFEVAFCIWFTATLFNWIAMAAMHSFFGWRIDPVRFNSLL